MYGSRDMPTLWHIGFSHYNEKARWALDYKSVEHRRRGALEERYPEPPLYPADPDERRRALELEDWFDEELGPYLRRLLFHELGRDPERMAKLVVFDAPKGLPQSD